MNFQDADPQPTEETADKATLSLVRYLDTILRAGCEHGNAFDSTLRDVADEMLALMHCQHCPLEPPAVLVQERKHGAHRPRR